MQMILAWVVFPLVLAAIGTGWGVLVERATGLKVHGALLVPLGLLAALLAATVVTASETTAPAAVAVVAGVGVVGLAAAWPGRRIALWPLLVAIGALLAYGAPVPLSGHATFAGVNALDDTATWLGLTDQLFAHSRAFEPSHIVYLYLHASGYPVGGFMLLGVGRGVVGVDAAWVYQPYLACCGALIGLSAYALLERFVASRPLRAGLAFVAAQPALLYGYSLWGSIKELTAAWVLIAGAALLAPYVGRAAPPPRQALALALPAAALITTWGPGAALWLAAPLVVVAASWVLAARRSGDMRALATPSGTLVAATVVLALPTLLLLSRFLASDDALVAKATGPSRSQEALGALINPLNPFQIAGIWPVGDFRLTHRRCRPRCSSRSSPRAPSARWS